MNPDKLRAPPPPSPPLIVRAPLSSEDHDSSSDLSTDSDSGFGSEAEPETELERSLLRSESMPVARLTADEDGDGDETEEEEGERFAVRVRVLDDGDDENPSLESEEEAFDEADGGLDTVARVSSSQSGSPSPVTDGVLEGNPNMNVEEDEEVRPMKMVSDTMETEEDRVLCENLNLIENSTKDGVDEHTSGDCTDETHNEVSGSDCAQGNTILDGDCIDETHNEISGSDCAQGNTSFTGEASLECTEKYEDLKPMEVESDNVEAEKDGVEEDSDVVQPEEAGIETGSSEFGFLDESSNAEETAEEVRVLSENLNLTENSVKNGVGEVKSGDSVDETRKENGDHGVLDEKDEVLGTDCAQSITPFTGEMSLESMEVKLTTIEIEMDGIEECMHKGLEHVDAATRETSNAVADSNQNQERDEEDGSVAVDSSQSDSSLNRLECRNDNKANKKPEEDEEGDSVVVDSSESESSVNKLESRNDDKVNKKAEEDDEDGSVVVDSSESESSVNNLESRNDNKPNKKAEEDDEDGSVVDSSGPESSVNNLESRNDDEVHKKAEEVNVGAKEGGGLQVSGKQMIRESETEIIRELLASASSSAATSNDTIIASNLRRILSDSYPAFLGSSGRRRSQPTILDSSNLAVDSNLKITMTEKEKKFHNKIELVRVKFLRLAFRLGYYLEEKMVTSVLYNLERIEDTKHWKFSFQTAREKAMELEREEKDKLDFSCTILVIGKAGAGKSATINSIFEEEKSPRNLFEPETSSVRKIEGVVNGIKIRILDTPGLKLSSQDQVSNIKMLSFLKKYMKKYPPDVVLYMDRLDIQNRDFNDLPLLRTVTSTLGPSIWSNAIIALTHASTAPPDGLDGRPLSYETSIEERSYVIQQSIRLATGDMNLMRPVALVENHPSCRRNTKGERVLPNGCRWRSKLLLLCCRSKILSEANALSPRVQDSSAQKLLNSLFRSPPMQFFLSLLFEQKPHPKLSSDINLDDFSDEEDEEHEYDNLPPFSPLTKSQIAELSKEQKRLYFDEYDYRVELLKNKQWKEQIRLFKEIKKRGQSNNVYEDDDDSPPSLALSQDITLPLSFDCDDPVYRYRSLEPSSNSTFSTDFLSDSNGWDHDYGYVGVRLQKIFAIASNFPGEISVGLRKDKEEFIINLDSSVSAKHGDNGSSLANFNVQTIGNQRAYSIRGETKFKNFKKNKMTAGFSVNYLGDTVATGVKLEDQVSIGKRVELGTSIGAVRAAGDVAYGANLEAKLMKKDYPIGQALAISGLSLVQYRGNLAFGGNLQAEVPIDRNSKIIVRVDINNKMSGRLTLQPCTSDPLVMVLIGLLPLANCILRRIWRKFFLAL